MLEVQREMKANCAANESADMFNTTNASHADESHADVDIDDFFLANASFTLPRLHEMMLVSYLRGLIL